MMMFEDFDVLNVIIFIACV